ncbi:MAG: glutamate-cysteine ligase family protein [Coriobacteriia bacterium]|nr:glutamate-cysteine ligase family protein [Coriobacteriia bacterium]
MVSRGLQQKGRSGLDSAVAAVVASLKSGAKSPADYKIGFEHEQLVVDQDNFTVPFAGEKGITSILEQLSPRYDQRITADPHDPSSPLIGLTRPDTAITLEPGAQLEFSSQPFWQVSELTTLWNNYQAELQPILDSFGYRALDVGYQPRTLVADIVLLPKQRYEMMNQHFKGTGERGINMMRGTASTQVAIDYDSEADALVKMRVAAALTPLFSLLTDNTPLFEGAPVEGYLKRTAIWNDVDAERSMIVPGLFSPGYGFADYARHVLTAPIILYDVDGVAQAAGNKAAIDCYDTSALTPHDIDHILSMFFFDVRLRNYVEIRCADSVPESYALAYVALLKGLFYDPQNLADLDKLCQHFTNDSVPKIKAALIQDGYDANVSDFYGESVQNALFDLLARAQRSLLARCPEEAAYLQVFEPLVAAKTTLAQQQVSL